MIGSGSGDESRNGRYATKGTNHGGGWGCKYEYVLPLQCFYPTQSLTFSLQSKTSTWQAGWQVAQAQEVHLVAVVQPSGNRSMLQSPPYHDEHRTLHPHTFCAKYVKINYEGKHPFHSTLHYGMLQAVCRIWERDVFLRNRHTVIILVLFSMTSSHVSVGFLHSA